MCSQGDVRHPRKIQILMMHELKIRKSDNLWRTATGAPQLRCFQVFKVRDLEVDEQSGHPSGLGRESQPEKMEGVIFLIKRHKDAHGFSLKCRNVRFWDRGFHEKHATPS